MPSAKLADPTARAKCGRCQHVFLLNENLVSPAPVVEPVVAPPSTPQQPTPAPEVQPSVSPPPVDDDFGRYLDEQMEIATSNIQSDKSNDSTENAWVNDLLKNADPNQVKINQSTNPKANPPQDIDLTTVIPPAPHGSPKKNAFKKVFKQKPTTQQMATRKSFIGQLMWLLGCVILLGLMVVQYTLFNLETLITNPAYHQKIQSFCALAKCSTPNADLGSIGVTSSLSNKKGKTDIIIVIFNRSSQEQLYPDLVVKLKNKDGVVVGDFIASRKDYLAESQNSILGNQQKRIMLTAKTDKAPTTVEVTPIYHKDF